MIITAKLSVFN